MMGRRKESRCSRSFSRRRCHSRLVRMPAQCLALVTACIPCVTFGEIAEIVEEGEESSCACAITYGAIAFFIGTPCLLSCCYRTKLRSKYALEEDPAPDWITHFFCEWCAPCQEYRELKARGLDPD
ncbi:hypothetical protein AAC387_Pa02g4901 [Persea americana]